MASMERPSEASSFPGLCVVILGTDLTGRCSPFTQPVNIYPQQPIRGKALLPRRELTEGGCSCVRPRSWFTRTTQEGGAECCLNIVIQSSARLLALKPITH